MAAKVYGKGWIAWAEEVTWNTAVNPPTRFAEIVGASSFKMNREKKFILTGNTRSVQHQVDGKLDTSGGFPTFLTYDGDELNLIKHAMGSVSSSTVSDSAYTHTFSLGESLPVGLTFDVNVDPTVYGKSFQYPGCLISKMMIEQALGDVAKISFETVGSGDMNEVDDTAASFPTITIADWNGLASPGVLTLNSVTVPCDNLTITLENTLATDVYTMTSNQRADLKPDGERIVTYTFDTFIEASDPVYALFTGNTEFAVAVTWKGALIGATSRYSFAVSSAKAKVTEHAGINGGAAGPIKGQVTIRGYASASLNDELSIVVINGDSAI